MNVTPIEPSVETSCESADPCAGPARGDIRVVFPRPGNDEVCTTGFVFSNSQIATAGHCSSTDAGYGVGWDAQLYSERTGGLQTVGQVTWESTSAQHIDALLFSVTDDAYWYPQPTVFRAATVGDPVKKLDGNAPVVSKHVRSSAAVGQTVCKSGASSQVESCGQIIDWQSDGLGVSGVGGRYGTFPCANTNGDSGGSIYGISAQFVSAYGVTHGYFWSGPTKVCTFSFVSDIEDLSGETVSIDYSGDRHGDFSLLATGRRVVDSRTSLNSTPLVANTSQFININIGWGSIPSDAIGVIVNITVTHTAGLGWLEAFTYNPFMPNLGRVASTSLLNYSSGQTRSGSAVLPVYTFNGNRLIGLYSSQNTDVIIDLQGFLVAPSKSRAISATAVAQSRIYSGTCYANTVCSVNVAAGYTAVTGVMLTVTVSQISGDGYLEASGVLDGAASVLNFQVVNGKVANLMFTAPINGVVKFKPSQTVMLNVDRRAVVFNPMTAPPILEDGEYYSVNRSRRIDIVDSGSTIVGASPGGMGATFNENVVLHSADAVVATIVGVNSSGDSYCWTSAWGEGFDGTSALNLSSSGAPNSDTVITKLGHLPGGSYVNYECSAGSARKILDVLGYID